MTDKDTISIRNNILKSGMVFGLIVLIVGSAVVVSTALKPISMNGEWIGFWGSLFGSLIGAVVTIVGVGMSIKHSQNMRQEDLERSDNLRLEDERKRKEPVLVLEFKYSRIEARDPCDTCANKGNTDSCPLEPEDVAGCQPVLERDFISVRLINTSENYALNSVLYFSKFLDNEIVARNQNVFMQLVKPNEERYLLEIDLSFSGKSYSDEIRFDLVYNDNAGIQYVMQYIICDNEKMQANEQYKPIMVISTINSGALVAFCNKLTFIEN